MEWGRWVDLDDCVVQELARRSGEDLGAVLAAGFGRGRVNIGGTESNDIAMGMIVFVQHLSNDFSPLFS